MRAAPSLRHLSGAAAGRLPLSESAPPPPPPPPSSSEGRASVIRAAKPYESREGEGEHTGPSVRRSRAHDGRGRMLTTL